MGQLQDLGFPLLVGVSRKRFLAELGPELDAATAAVTAIVAHHGAWCVRVNEVAASKAAVAVAARIRKGR